MNEAQLQQAIRLAIGVMPDVLIFKNSVGVANHERGGRSWVVPYGLCVGSSDLIGLVAGRFIALEVKAPRGRLTKEQGLFLELVRKYGGFACRVDSVDEAISAVQRARTKESE